MPSSDQLYKSSIEMLKKYQSPTGGFIASPNFRVYNYSWFRDGAFIADALWNAGEKSSARNFDLWVARTILAREEKIEKLIGRKLLGDLPTPEEHLHCRYTLEGKEVEEDWTNFQLDGFGTWLWTVPKHFSHSAPAEITSAVELLIKYLTEFWDSPSFDWWEESPGHVHTSSIGCIAVGLESISQWDSIDDYLKERAESTSELIRKTISARGIYDGRLTKWLDGTGLDSSNLALIEPMNFISADSAIASQTIQAVRAQLGFPGVHRHPDDTYFGGGEWLILSAFLGLCHVARGEIEDAYEILRWIESKANSVLELPEQVNSNLLFSEFEQPWIDKWGISAQPLLWSHAMYIELKSKLEGSR